jgi:hypothetical protein
MNKELISALYKIYLNRLITEHEFVHWENENSDNFLTSIRNSKENLSFMIKKLNFSNINWSLRLNDQSSSVDLFRLYSENLISYSFIYTGTSVGKIITYPIYFFRIPISSKEKDSISKIIKGADFDILNKLNYNFEIFNYIEEFLPDICLINASSFFTDLVVDFLEINDDSEIFFTASKIRFNELIKSGYSNYICELN